MKAAGVFGGTFDPVHIGHLITANAVYEMRDLEKIIFIPAFISPHKLDRPHSSPEHRYNMLNAAVENIPYFEVSDVELQRKEISYTVDTIRELKKKYDRLELIIGYDNLLNFSTWKDPEELTDLAKLVVLTRNIKEAVVRNKFFNKAVLLETPLIEVSSTQIRERAAKGLHLEFLVPQKVLEYINTFNLYK